MTLPKGWGKTGGGRSSNSGKSGHTNPGHGHGKAIAILVVIAIFAILIGTWIWSVADSYARQDQLIALGCVPAAFNQYGVVVSWLNCQKEE